MKKLLVVFFLILFFSPGLVHAEVTEVDSLLQELSISEPDNRRVDILLNISKYLLGTDPQAGLEYARQAESLAKKIGYKKGFTDALVRIGEACYYLGNYEEAIVKYLEAIAIHEEEKNYFGVAAVENNIGAVYYNQNKLEDALKHYNRAIIYSVKSGDDGILSMSKTNIGNLYFSTDDLDNALLYYNESLKIKEKLSDRRGIALLLNNIGNVYGTKGEYALSRDHFIRSLKISEELKDHFNASMTMNNIGLLYQMEGDSVESFHYMKRSLYTAYEIGAKDLIKDAYLALAEAYFHFKNYKSAFITYKNYTQVKDSLVNEEITKNINELQEKYKSAQNEKKIALQQSELFHEAEFKQSLYWIIGLICSVLFLAILLSVYLVKLNRERREKNQQLESQKKTIELKNLELFDKNKNITDSITYASRIQSAILPPRELMKAAFADSFVFYKPKDIVSGDFYWMEHQSDHTVFAVADCTGHGVPGAFVSIAGSNLLQEAVTVHQLLCPSKILQELNKGLAKMLHQESRTDSVRDGMDIALCVFDRQQGVLEFSGAFNPLWLFRNGEFIEYEANKLPVGDYIENGKSEFKKAEIKIQSGDVVYIFSDGYPDQFGGPHGKKLKYSGFKKILQNNHQLSMSEQVLVLENEFYNWKGELEQLDDVCVMGIRF